MNDWINTWVKRQWCGNKWYKGPRVLSVISQLQTSLYELRIKTYFYCISIKINHLCLAMWVMSTTICKEMIIFVQLLFYIESTEWILANVNYACWCNWYQFYNNPIIMHCFSSHNEKKMPVAKEALRLTKVRWDEECNWKVCTYLNRTCWVKFKSSYGEPC